MSIFAQVAQPGGFNKGQAKRGQQGLASFTRYSSLRCKTGTSDNALPEWFMSVLALPETGQNWDL